MRALVVVPMRHLLVAPVGELPDTRSGVEKQRTGQVHLGAPALVEHPDLRPVADADDVPVDCHGVAGT